MAEQEPNLESNPFSVEIAIIYEGQRYALAFPSSSDDPQYRLKKKHLNSALDNTLMSFGILPSKENP